MNIVEIDYSDLTGRHFNGYELHRGLLSKGIHAEQVVKWKEGILDTVSMYGDDKVFDCQIRALEEKYSVQNLLFPYASELEKLEAFQKADIVHYHLIHKGAFSLLDLPELMKQKKSVWTIHDPWIVTGKCIHPLDCIGWKNGCQKCQRLSEPFEMKEDNAAFMWKVKKEILSQVNPDIIVASEFMKHYIQESPITSHFSRIHKIPFGIEADKYNLREQNLYQAKLGIPKDKFVIAFRCDKYEVKGCKYIYNALRKIGTEKEIFLVCVGDGDIPDDIQESYQMRSFAWLNDEQLIREILIASDLFLMPSLAESFGLMAVEAMAAGCAVICFEGTVPAEITEAPYCGIAVKYKSASDIAEKIMELKVNCRLTKELGQKGHELVKRKYRFEDYVDRHIHLYEEILNRI